MTLKEADDFREYEWFWFSFYMGKTMKWFPRCQTFLFLWKVVKFAKCCIYPLTFIKVSVHSRDFTYRIALFPLSSRPTWQTIFKHSAIPHPCKNKMFTYKKRSFYHLFDVWKSDILLVSCEGQRYLKWTS